MTDTTYLLPELGPLKVLSDTNYWGIRFKDGTVHGLYQDRLAALREFEYKQKEAAALGLEREFLASTEIVQHQRLFLATQWEPDPELQGMHEQPEAVSGADQ